MHEGERPMGAADESNVAECEARLKAFRPSGDWYMVAPVCIRGMPSEPGAPPPAVAFVDRHPLADDRREPTYARVAEVFARRGMPAMGRDRSNGELALFFQLARSWSDTNPLRDPELGQALEN